MSMSRSQKPGMACPSTAPVAQRLAEIASDGAREEAAVLHGQRIVEAEALAEFVDVLGLDVHGKKEQHGIAAQPHQEEDGGEREEDHERGLGEPRDEIRAHARSVPDKVLGNTWRSSPQPSPPGRSAWRELPQRVVARSGRASQWSSASTARTRTRRPGRWTLGRPHACVPDGSPIFRSRRAQAVSATSRWARSRTAEGGRGLAPPSSRPGRGPGAGPGGARPRHAAPLGGGPWPRGAVLREGPRPDPRGHAGDRSATAGGGTRRDGRPRRADRARLAVRGW